MIDYFSRAEVSSCDYMVDFAGCQKLPELIWHLVCSLRDVDVADQQDKLNGYREF